MAMRLSPGPVENSSQHILQELREGIRYAFGFPPIREILLLLAVINLAAMPLTVLMPFFATNVLHGGPDTLGLLTSAMGCGALLGAFHLALRKNVIGLGRLIAWAGTLFGLSLIAFSFSQLLWVSMLALAGAGFALMTETASSNTILQTIVDDDKRGRVMSFYAMALLGVAPLGSLLAGSLASYLGPSHVVQLAGMACMVSSAVFAFRLPALRAFIRPIYRRIGVLPDVTSGIVSEAEYTAPDGEGQ
jgi:MFS family permease